MKLANDIKELLIMIRTEHLEFEGDFQYSKITVVAAREFRHSDIFTLGFSS